MKTLRKALNDYLALRRSLGFKLTSHERTLRQFVAFMHTTRTGFITTQVALAWAQLPQHTSPAHRAQRLGMVRDFARHLSATDPRTEIPPQGLLPAQPQRTQPYIYSDDQILRLVCQTAKLAPADGLRPHTYHAFFGLLAVTGMRVNEAMALSEEDADLKQGVLVIKESKFNKTRFLPVAYSTLRKLRAYARHRDRLVPVRHANTFFLTDSGTRLRYGMVWRAFVRISQQMGLRADAGGHGPRIHDLRHTFAVKTLIHWYRCGLNPEQRLPLLSAYLGHTKVSDTYWYLSAVPELLGAVNTRLENFLGGLV